ncbi:GFA family protein [Thalassotalea fonticola]|uniref:GFA family protein n=1 Tax=Thalassotalea fonticola TaxID=3065649 RepID=A0ABZ0GKJ1_9GAMM|nr:GFA family protein [Colwelliaceae bacterium S1-1]
MEKSMVGQCLCRYIAFKVLGCLPNLYQCHCSLCRKLSGSTSDTATFLNIEQFQWVKGTDAISSFILESGYRSDFCKRCGSTVPHLMQNEVQYWIPAGLLEQDADSMVTAHLFVESKASWDVVSGDAIQYSTMPDMDTLNKKLQK